MWLIETLTQVKNVAVQLFCSKRKELPSSKKYEDKQFISLKAIEFAVIKRVASRKHLCSEAIVLLRGNISCSGETTLTERNWTNCELEEAAILQKFA
jgi:hypothetical protein